MKQVISGLVALVLCGLALAACSDTATTAPKSWKQGDYSQVLQAGNYTRTYLLHLPPGVSEGKSLPLLLVFHGGGGDGKGMVRLTSFSTLADRQKFIVVYPDALNRNWNDGRDDPKMKAQRENIDDVSFVSALVDYLGTNYPVDLKRVYATGMSNGGMFTHRVGCELSGKIAAIAPVAGLLPLNIAPNCAPTRPVPVLQIMGTADPLVPWQGGTVAEDLPGGGRGEVISESDTVKRWLGVDGCPGSPSVTNLPDTDRADGTTVRKETYSPCKSGSEINVYVIENGGHTWPGGSQYLPKSIIGNTNRDFDASSTIWDFFSRHTL